MAQAITHLTEIYDLPVRNCRYMDYHYLVVCIFVISSGIIPDSALKQVSVTSFHIPQVHHFQLYIFCIIKCIVK